MNIARVAKRKLNWAVALFPMLLRKLGRGAISVLAVLFLLLAILATQYEKVKRSRRKRVTGHIPTGNKTEFPDWVG
ncbi:MAG: hypothetical protein ACFFCW_38490 [Candidatus Hodarchaeota archaeon]